MCSIRWKCFRKWRSKHWHMVWLLLILIYTHTVHTSMSILNCPSVPFNGTQAGVSHSVYAKLPSSLFFVLSALVCGRPCHLLHRRSCSFGSVCYSCAGALCSGHSNQFHTFCLPNWGERNSRIIIFVILVFLLHRAYDGFNVSQNLQVKQTLRMSTDGGTLLS